MWEVMFECHKLQFCIISVAFYNGNSKISIRSDAHRQITIHLVNELNSMSSSFTKWISAQKYYLLAINNWLDICCPRTEKATRRRRRARAPSLRDYGPPIYITCGLWLDKLNKLDEPDNWKDKNVTDSIKSLVAETNRFIPHQEKNPGKKNGIRQLSMGSESGVNLMRDEVSEEWISGFDHFQSSLVGFLGNLNTFAEYSVDLYADLRTAIDRAKTSYEERVHREAKMQT